MSLGHQGLRDPVEVAPAARMGWKQSSHVCEQFPPAPNVEMRWHDTPMYCSIFRFDAQMLVTPHIYERPGWQSPLLHLRRLGPSGIFENYAQHFEDMWATARPMEQ